MTTRKIYEAPRATPLAGETIVTSTCAHNCGGCSVVNAHVRDDRIVASRPLRYAGDRSIRRCLPARGIGQIERTYHRTGCSIRSTASLRDAVAFARAIRDPERHRFSTPSGKIEIYSMACRETDPCGQGTSRRSQLGFHSRRCRRSIRSVCIWRNRGRTHSIHGALLAMTANPTQPKILTRSPNCPGERRSRASIARDTILRFVVQTESPACPSSPDEFDLDPGPRCDAGPYPVRRQGSAAEPACERQACTIAQR
jgi:hypothetical protein